MVIAAVLAVDEISGDESDATERDVGADVRARALVGAAESDDTVAPAAAAVTVDVEARRDCEVAD